MTNPFYFRIGFFIFIAFATFLFLREGNHSGIHIPHFDKIAHFGVFYLLALLFFNAFKINKMIGILILSLYGIGIEYWQGLLPTREASVADFIADFIGILAFLLLTKLNLPLHLSKVNHEG